MINTRGAKAPLTVTAEAEKPGFWKMVLTEAG
jgi:hypothetical protein